MLTAQAGRGAVMLPLSPGFLPAGFCGCGTAPAPQCAGHGWCSGHNASRRLSSAIGARIHAYEDRKTYQRYYNAWSKLSGSKASAYEREHEFELRKYRQADEALNRWEADGERLDYKGWQTAMKHINKERFALEYELRGQKEEIRRLEVVKREFIRENRRTRPERYER